MQKQFFLSHRSILGKKVKASSLILKPLCSKMKDSHQIDRGIFWQDLALFVPISPLFPNDKAKLSCGKKSYELLAWHAITRTLVRTPADMWWGSLNFWLRWRVSWCWREIYLFKLEAGIRYTHDSSFFFHHLMKFSFDFQKEIFRTLWLHFHV